MEIEAGDSVTIEYTGKLADGTVFDTSRESVADEHGLNKEDRTFEPLTVEVGTGELIEGLDEALVGMALGEEATVEVPPEKGYGEWTEDRVRTYETAALSDQIVGELPEVGSFIQFGQGSVGEVVSVGEDHVEVDLNHRYAGEELVFEVEILDIER